MTGVLTMHQVLATPSGRRSLLPPKSISAVFEKAYASFLFQLAPQHAFSHVASALSLHISPPPIHALIIVIPNPIVL